MSSKKQRPETETEQIFKELTRQYSVKTRRQRFDSALFSADAGDEASSEESLNLSVRTIEDEDSETSHTEEKRPFRRKTAFRDSYRKATITRQNNVSNDDMAPVSVVESSSSAPNISSDIKMEIDQNGSSKSPKKKTWKRHVKKKLRNFTKSFKTDDNFSARQETKKTSTGTISKAELERVCSLSISRHQSLHPTRAPSQNTTGPTSQSITRSASKSKKRQTRHVTQTLDDVVLSLTTNAHNIYGRLPSGSSFELPLGTKYDKDLATPISSDFSGAQSRTISPQSESLRSSLKRTNSNEQKPLNATDGPRPHSAGINASEIIPPTPATTAGSRPTSAFFPAVLEQSIGAPVPDESDRDRAIEEIGSQLKDLFNDPQYNEELHNIQNNLTLLLTDQLRNVQFQNYVGVMQPFLNRKNLANMSQTNLDIEGLMISAQIASTLPSLARRIYTWISQHISISFQQLQEYSKDPDEDGKTDDDKDKGSRV